jgi:formylglycine-generating enzyme required for sulfatase activity
MKSCPDCNRTFDDTMTFCLVDGSILSAPFDPNATHHSAASRDPDPAPTEMLFHASNAEATTRSRQTERGAMPVPPTIASPNAVQAPQAETPSTGEKNPSVDKVAAQSGMKTIKATPPEVVLSNSQRIASATGTYPGGESPQTHPTGLKWSALFAGIVLLAILIGGSVWLIKRARTRISSTGTAQPQQAKQTANNAAPRGKSFTENINGTEIEMVSVPDGTFLMGSALSEDGRDKDEGPQSEVTVQNFQMSKYEVTQAQYKAVTSTNPSNFKGDDLPVDSVSWNDAVEFCRKLSRLTGRVYRLPTEAEWEYACRAGTKGPYPGNLDAIGWYVANSRNQTHPVGQKEPNGFGLYDMNGNVWEWCQSKYKPYPYQTTDGRENVQDNDVRVLRGGSWESSAGSTRSAYRRRVLPDGRSIGFRIVLVAQ